ncbi:transcription cofactor vestigial-like protein 3 [Pitangus sulphuratus]|nr:transcription cofactor vestigial-like protein 3 [Pitangus sulphuratus]
MRWRPALRGASPGPPRAEDKEQKKKKEEEGEEGEEEGAEGDKSGFPYFAKRRSECVPVSEYERISVSGEDLCLREAKTLQDGKVKTPFMKKLAVYNKMQESLEVTLPSKQEEDEKDQPAEMEYLNSRCVLFTYFQGDIGSVVDEHFSRALSQASSFNSETALTKSKTGLSPLWRGTFPTPDPSSWPGHGLHQTAPPPPPAASESWHYPLASQEEFEQKSELPAAEAGLVLSHVQMYFHVGIPPVIAVKADEL